MKISIITIILLSITLHILYIDLKADNPSTKGGNVKKECDGPNMVYVFRGNGSTSDIGGISVVKDDPRCVKDFEGLGN